MAKPLRSLFSSEPSAPVPLPQRTDPFISRRYLTARPITPSSPPPSPSRPGQNVRLPFLPFYLAAHIVAGRSTSPDSAATSPTSPRGNPSPPKTNPPPSSMNPPPPPPPAKPPLTLSSPPLLLIPPKLSQKSLKK